MNFRDYSLLALKFLYKADASSNDAKRFTANPVVFLSEHFENKRSKIQNSKNSKNSNFTHSNSMHYSVPDLCEKTLMSQYYCKLLLVRRSTYNYFI